MKNNNKFDLKGKIKNYYYYCYYHYLILKKNITTIKEKHKKKFKRLKNISTDKLNIIINIIKITINIITIKKKKT